MHPIRIGLLLDSFKVPIWQKAIMETIQNDTNLKLIVAITNKSASLKGQPGRGMYRLLRKLDRTIFKSKHDLFGMSDIAHMLSDVDQHSIKPKQTKFKDEFEIQDLEWIRMHQIDILIRFGFRILTGEILHVAKYGVWSLHHGDSSVNRGGPPAFWEVVNGDPITGVTLQILSEKLDAGNVIGKAYCKTDRTSFGRNQNSVYATGIELLVGRLSDFGRQGAEVFFGSLKKQKPQSFASTLYRDPSNIKALSILFSFAWRRLKEFLVQIFYIDQWVIFYNPKADDPFSFKGSLAITSPEHTDWADPFVIYYQKQHYIFFESLERGERRGKIKCLRMDQPTASPILVLAEDHHLSYPTITEHQNNLYLLTESAEAKSVALYECLEFPHKWRKVKYLLEGAELFDPTLYKHEGLWYLFGTQKSVPGSSADMYLHIYYTDDLLNGKWQPHAMNPITRDVRGSRPAGRIFYFKDKLIRPAQIGAPKYGFSICFQEITKLSPTEYEEVPVNDLKPWMDNMLATHTYSATEDCYLVDGQLRSFRFF